MRYLLLVFLLVELCLLSKCAETEVQPTAPQIRVRFSALPTKIISPQDNPSTEEKIALGRLLFFDPILSGNKDVACATCHHPSNGWAEFRTISIGVNGQGFGSKRKFKEPNVIPFVKRNAQTILNTAFNGMDAYGRYHPERSEMFWDNRVVSLERQALEPILALEEMRGPNFSEPEILPEIVRRLREIPIYQDLFDKAFKQQADSKATITETTIAQAIAAFERSLTTPNSRFDQYLRGEDGAISAAELAGFERFKAVGCANCHNGPMFSDFRQHVLGVPENTLLPEPDAGPAADFAFRTPSLRNLRFTAPYMHNGKFMSLLSVLEFYEDIAGGQERNRHVSKEQYDPLVEQLSLRVRDMRPIISFLNALNDEDFDQQVPVQVPSGLAVGGNIN